MAPSILSSPTFSPQRHKRKVSDGVPPANASDGPADANVATSTAAEAQGNGSAASPAAKRTKTDRPKSGRMASLASFIVLVKRLSRPKAPGSSTTTANGAPQTPPKKNSGKQRVVFEESSTLSSQPTTATVIPSPPGSPISPKQGAGRYHELSSGTHPITHEILADAEHSPRSIHHNDVFTCSGSGGVDVRKLLGFTRRTLYSKVALLGGNAIVSEQWTCKINKMRPSGNYKVTISYSGIVARADKEHSDPQKPVALDAAHSIPGLMTIVNRAE